MPLNIQPTTSQQRKLLFLETLLNTTDKVTKVSPHSINSGIAGGISKISGKAEKDIILALSQLFPDTAYSSELDQVAKNFGLATRFTSSGSSVYVRVVGTPGTTYTQGLNTFSSTTGIQFEMEDTSYVIPVSGFGYIKLRSLIQGSQTNIPPLSLTKVSPIPSGHRFVINESEGIGGRDIESDELFRIRIKDGPNILARGTLAMLEQVFMNINDKVLKLFYQGINSLGKVRIAIATQNGQNLSTPELEELIQEGNEYFCLTDNMPISTQFVGVELVNIEYEPIDISFRCSYDTSQNPDTIRQNIQVNINKYLDFRTFEPTQSKVEWDNLLQIIKNTTGIKYVPDQFFNPRSDININTHKLPRMRGFLMLDLDGNIIQDFQGNLNPVFYPSTPDFSLQQSILNNF